MSDTAGATPRRPDGNVDVRMSIDDLAAELAVDHDEARHDGRGVVTINGMSVPSDKVAEGSSAALDTLEGST